MHTCTIIIWHHFDSKSARIANRMRWTWGHRAVKPKIPNFPFPFCWYVQIFHFVCIPAKIRDSCVYVLVAFGNIQLERKAFVSLSYRSAYKNSSDSECFRWWLSSIARCSFQVFIEVVNSWGFFLGIFSWHETYTIVCTACITACHLPYHLCIHTFIDRAQKRGEKRKKTYLFPSLLSVPMEFGLISDSNASNAVDGTRSHKKRLCTLLKANQNEMRSNEVKRYTQKMLDWSTTMQSAQVTMEVNYPTDGLRSTGALIGIYMVFVCSAHWLFYQKKSTTSHDVEKR